MCYQASRFSAYKCLKSGATGLFKARRVIYSDMHMWDNIEGTGPLISQKNFEYDGMSLEIRDSTFYG